MSKWKCKINKLKKKKRSVKINKGIILSWRSILVQWHDIVKINKHNIFIVFFFYKVKSLCLTFQRKYWIQSNFTWSTFFFFFPHHLRKYNYLSPNMLKCYGQHACKSHKTSFSFQILFYLSFVFALDELLSLRAEDN